MEPKDSLKTQSKVEEISSSEEGESEYSSGDEGDDTIPTGNSEKLLRYIRRDLNMLSDESKVKRKFGLMNLYELFVQQKTKIDK